MEILQKFNILDYYLMGVVVAIFLIFILDRYFIDMVKIDIKEEIPDAEPGENGKWFDQLDYIIMALMSWLSVIGLICDISRYIYLKTKKA